MVLLLVMAAAALTAWVVIAPLRGGAERAARRDESVVADLEARRDAKYREIREAELDYRTGKLSEPDWKAMDRELRAEAVAILRELDRYSDGTS